MKPVIQAATEVRILSSTEISLFQDPSDLTQTGGTGHNQPVFEFTLIKSGK